MKKTSLALFLTALAPLASCSRSETTAPEGKPDPNVVEMSVAAQKNAGLQIAPASPVPLTEYLRVMGTVQPIDSRVAQARSLAKGRVQDVLVRVGDRVSEGQPLARVDNIEAGELAASYHSAQAELQKLKIQQANAARQLERSQSLVDIGVTSRKDFEMTQAEHNASLAAIKAQESVIAGLEAKLKRLGVPEADAQKSPVTTIRSSFAGVVIKVGAAPGDIVDSDTPLFSVADLSQVWVQAEVYERDLGRVRTGQAALISVDTYPEETFSGKVAHISDTLDPKTRTAQVRCVVDNRDRRLKLDMFVTADVPTSFTRNALAVPSAAIQQIGGKSVVFVKQSDQKFQIREIKMGQVAGGQTEIVSGLKEHEPVVVQGAYHLKSVRMLKEISEEG